MPPPRATQADRAGAPTFRDDARAAGLSVPYRSPETGLHQIPEVNGGGVGLLDFDGDGRLDIFQVQGGTRSHRRPARSTDEIGGDRLYRNRGDGTFEDVSIASGIASMARGSARGLRSVTSTTTATPTSS